MSALPAFDTHAYVKRLRAAGFNEAQAEAQAELQSEVLSSLVTEKLATKEDMMELKNSTKHDMLELRNEVKNDISELRHELKNDIAALKSETHHEIIRIMGKFNQLNWMIGFLLTGVVTILFKLFLHS
jgi:carbamoylphosphate synthase small subunit